MAATPVLDRRAARREEILDAARRVFAARGFRGTTIADIADEAGIALGTIYLYYPSKEDVFAGLNQLLAGIITSAIGDGRSDVSLAESVERRIGNVFEACAANRDLLRLVVLNHDPGTGVARRMRDAADDRSRPLVEVMARAATQGLIRDDDPAIMTRLIQGLVTIAVYQAFVVDDGSEADKYRKSCADMVLAYLTPPMRE